MKRILMAALVIGFALITCFLNVPVRAEETGTDLVILSTTDMHGKCWEEDLLTGQKVRNNMLRVSTAVTQARETCGRENVILIDNGDLFQGTAVSEIHMLQSEHAPDEPEAMAVCLKEIGYDALVLGNHEFNYSWDLMHGVYEYLEAGGVSVLAANVYYDGTDPVHEAGQNAFGTYIVREVIVNGHPHRIGILGLENNDITRWDLHAHYPGMIFAHPDNSAFDQAEEVRRYIPRMLEDGCEMIIVSYHGGLGDADDALSFGVNTENQGMRIVENTDNIDLLILGHDHFPAYSNTFVTDRSGRDVPVVNSGGQELTQTVFRLREDESGALTYELVSSENLDLSAFEPDSELEAKIRPYAELADSVLDEPIGRLSGTWDGSEEFYIAQSDTMDLVNAAMIDAGTQAMTKKYGASDLERLRAASGLDHLDVDAALSSVTNDGYIPHAGGITARDIYRLYRFSNTLLVLPMYGREIKAVLEENASERLASRVLRGQVYYYTRNDNFTNIIAGGINFHYDMAQPEGERVVIESFCSGRAYDPDAIYLVGVNDYILGNELCGLRAYQEADALWSQAGDGQGDTIQDSIRTYICKFEDGVSPDAFNWEWYITYSADPTSLAPWEGQIAASLADAPEDGHRYVLYLEAQGCTLTGEDSVGTMDTVDIDAYGDLLIGELPESAHVFTAHMVAEDQLTLTDETGRYLTCGESGGLSLTKEMAGDDLSVWQLIACPGGYNVRSVGAEQDQVIEYYDGQFKTYRFNEKGLHVFNFYEVPDTAQ